MRKKYESHKIDISMAHTLKKNRQKEFATNFAIFFFILLALDHLQMTERKKNKKQKKKLNAWKAFDHVAIGKVK